tara:strand:+ start:1217 stop:1474 length:258 start_codon:yes stop_codon:yes gene_type:complete
MTGKWDGKSRPTTNLYRKNFDSIFNKIKYQIWYIPRIQDELPVANFSNLDDAIEQMDQLKVKRPKAYPHHYIWDVINKQKVNNGK